MATRMQQRRGTAAQWLSTNNGNGPVLNVGEIGYETDTNKFKIGDGTNHWIDLNYFADSVELGGNIDDYIPLTQKGAANGVATLNADGVIPSNQIPSLVGLDSEITTAVNNAVTNLVGVAPSALDTLAELAGALNNDEDFSSTVATELSLKASITYVDNQIDTLESTLTSDLTDELNLKAATTYVDSEISSLSSTLTSDISTAVTTHNQDTTGVHGIADTSALVTLSGTQTLANKTLNNFTLNLELSEPVELSSAGTSSTYAATQGPAVRHVTDFDLLRSTNFFSNTIIQETETGITWRNPPSNTWNTATWSEMSSWGGYSSWSAESPGEYTCNIGDTLNGQTCTHVDNPSEITRVGSTNVYRVTNPTTAGFNGAANDGYAGMTFDSTPYTGLLVGSSQDGSDILIEFAEFPDTTFPSGTVATATLLKAISPSEFGYLDGVTSNIQTQIDSKVSTSNLTELAQDAVGNSVGTGLSYNDSTGAISVDETIIDSNISAALVAPTISTSLTLDGSGDFTIAADANIVLDATTEVYIGSAASGNEVATKSYVDSGLGNKLNSSTAASTYAPIASPTFTGTSTTDDLVVNGDFTVNGTNFAASATSITIEDNMVQLAHQNAGNTVDLGLVVAYNDGSAKHAGIVRDVSDAKWKLFKDVTTEPTTTVNFGQGSLDDLAINNLNAVDVTLTGDISANKANFTGTVTGVTKTHVGLGNVDNTSDANKPVSTATQTALDAKSDKIIVINPQTSNYTLTLSDVDDLVEMNVGSANTLTVPANADVALPVGTRVHIVQTGSGQTTITPGSGVTVNGTPGLKTRAQWSAVTLVKRATNTWVAFGDLTA